VYRVILVMLELVCLVLWHFGLFRLHLLDTLAFSLFLQPSRLFGWVLHVGRSFWKGTKFFTINGFASLFALLFLLVGFCNLYFTIFGFCWPSITVIFRFCCFGRVFFATTGSLDASFTLQFLQHAHLNNNNTRQKIAANENDGSFIK
jgi:hypothetical protein